MSDFRKALEDAALPVLLTLIPVAGGLLRAWFLSRQRRFEEMGASAWEHADFVSSSAPGQVTPEERERLAVESLRRKGFSDDRAVKVARATRTEAIPLVTPAAVADPPASEPFLPAEERPTLPGVPPPKG